MAQPKYVGLQTQISRNNRSCVLMLLSFPAIVLGLIYAACYIWAFSEQLNSMVAIPWKEHAFTYFTKVGPIAFLCVLAWFLIAYFYNVSIISFSTGARYIERKENKRVYNLIENICVATGTSMPKVQIINVPAMNAYASGINESTYTIALTQGIIDNLDDDELEGVIAHELSHIRNNDARVMIVSIVFVGIFLLLAQLFYYLIRTGFARAGSASRKRGKGGGSILLLCFVMMILCYFAYLFSFFIRFAVSRKREYLADAGSAEITHKPWALASALRKISGNSDIPTIKDSAVSQLFIDSSEDSSFFSFFTATHPPIEKRIAFLEQL